MVLVTTTVPAVVARGRTQGHCRSEHSKREADGLRRLEERRHRCRSDGALTPSAPDPVSPDPICTNIAVTLRWVQRQPSALATAGDRSWNAPVNGPRSCGASSAFPSVVPLYLQSKLLESSMLPLAL